MVVILVGSVFGPVVPGLLVLVPCAIMTLSCALSWLQSEPRNEFCQESFGGLLAANVMVQQPATILAPLVVSLTWPICVFTMVDLGFSYGAMIFYGFLSVALFCVFGLTPTSRSVSRQLSSEKETIWFNPRCGEQAGEGVDVVRFRVDGI